MSDVTAGDDRFVIRASPDGERWTAQAVRTDNGDPFGPPQTAPTEAEAIARMARWLRWQASHAEALGELQRAERAYHRAVTGQAFAGEPEAAPSTSSARDLLGAIDAARIRLDAVRSQRPV